MSSANLNNKNDDPQTLSQNVLRAIVECLKMSSKIGAGPGYKFYSTFRGFSSLMEREKKSALSIMKSLISGQNTRNSFDSNDADDKFDFMLEYNANMFELVASQLDDLSNQKVESEELILATKNVQLINTSWNKTPDGGNQAKSSNSFSLLSSKNIQRPQLTFKEKIDNSNSPFIPKINEKPNALKPLAILVERNNEDDEEYSHPYEWELERFKPFPQQLEASDPIVPPPLEETPLIMIQTEEDLNAMINDLKSQQEFALDIENHSYRSFQGFSCLLQISTRKTDYIIDAIKLRSELHILNEVLTDPKIVKILHGADMDVLWLQRDFGLYIVNLFDTGQAARVLNFPHLSLAYLLKHYCNLTVDKQFQLADWRIRPLPSPLIKYAREDTHYLLYVYDWLKNDLLKNGNATKNLLFSVLERSKDLCLKKYQKLLFNNEKYLEIYKKSRKSFDARQLFCLKQLYAWRDGISRIEDESYGYVLPNHMLLRIAETMPKEPEGILACCNPIPPLVLQQLNELHLIVTRANNSPLNMLETNHCKQVVPTVKPVNVNNILHSLHDIHHNKDQKTKFLLSMPDSTDWDSVLIPLKKKPSLSLTKNFMKPKDTHSKTAQEVAKIINSENKPPYTRYLLTLEYKDANNTKDSERTSNNETLDKSFIELKNSSVSENSLEISANETSNTSSLLCENVNSETEEQPDNSQIKKKKKRKKNGPVDPDVESPKRTKVNQQTPSSSFKAFNYAEAGVHDLITNIREQMPVSNQPQKNWKNNRSWKKKKSGKQWLSKSSWERKSWPKS